MRAWVSCEEKLDLLDRLYSIAHAHLGKKDETTYVAMRQEFLQRIDAVKAIRERAAESRKKAQRAVQEKSGEETSPETAEPRSAELNPEEVVRLFVSCWDSQDFATEYSLLSPEFLRAEGAPSELQDYVRDRKAKYSSRLLKGQMAKQLETICCCRISGARALVDAVETRKWHSTTAATRRRYHLRHYPEGWLIDYFENVIE